MTTGATACKPLPPFTPEVKRIGAWLGAEATLTLVEACGGTRIFIPRRPTEANELTAKVGLGVVQLLCEHWGGDYLKVPVARGWRILILRSRGLTYPEIARTLNCSENTVWRTLNKRHRADSQPDMFTG